MKVNRIIIATFILFFGEGILAQPTSSKNLLPVLAPPSPEAAAFKTYGNYQVNLFTGIPEITIPIYEIKIGELKVPISLNYHSSGIKVNQVASRAGLGWDLQAGGAITRKIMGRPDELEGNYLGATPSSNGRVKSQEINSFTQDGLDYLNYVDIGVYDVEPDIFSYSFPGHSGKFLFNQKDNFKPILIPYAPISVEFLKPNQNSMILSTTDESGILYKFDSTEWTSTGGSTSTYATSAWLLSKMISANKQDSILFRYSKRIGGGITDSYTSEFVVLNDECVGDYQPDFGTPYTNFGSVSTWWKQMTQIDFKNGKVVIESDPESRQDFSGQYQLQPRINAIKIYNYDVISKSYNLLRIIQFFHSYFINGIDESTKRLKLDSLQIKSSIGNVIESYKFNYNTSIQLPSNKSTRKDYWGYYNNVINLRPDGIETGVAKMQVPYSAPNNPTSTIWIGGSNTKARDPDPNYMQAYSLQKIIFPTGGYTQFEFETNQYLDEQGNPKYAGGLRIKTIKSYTSSTAPPLIKTYKYGQNESGYGRNNFLLENYFFFSSQSYRKFIPGGGSCPPFQSTKRMRTFFANPTNDLESYDGAPVVYPVVTEYSGDAVSNLGKTIYHFLDRADSRTNIIGLGKPLFDSYHFIRGLLTNKAEYKKNPDNTFTLVKENRKRYQYFPFKFTTSGIGLVVFKSLISETANGSSFVGLSYGDGCTSPWNDSNSYGYNNYDVLSGDNKLVADTIITYDPNDASKNIATISTYTYDDITHLQISQTKSINSVGQTNVSTYTYPYNYISTPYTLMTNNHIYDKVIQETKTINNIPITVQTNNYGSFSGNNFLTNNIQLKIKSNATETKARFNSYDTRGNILEMQKENDVKQSYMWDYQGLLPIAEVTGAAQTEIAYTSFENDGTGGWNGINVLSFIVTESVSGKKSCSQSNFSFTKSGLNSAETYIVTYWTKNGTYTVNSSPPTFMKTINGWTLYEHKILNPSDGNITVTGSGIIDELRLYPLGAQMKTYTYEPLIGITSQCDINNNIIRYTYDQLGRLLFVRDAHNNILKKICYNYEGQPGDCSIYGNVSKSIFFTKNNCPIGTGSQVNYLVPENTYYAPLQSDADALAQNDINANGQNFANQTGTCTAPQATVSGQNYISAPYTVSFTNTATNQPYYMYLYPGSGSAIQMPSGNYNVSFNPFSGSVTTYFNVNGFSSYGTTTNFNNVPIYNGSTVRIGY